MFLFGIYSSSVAIYEDYNVGTYFYGAVAIGLQGTEGCCFVSRYKPRVN